MRELKKITLDNPLPRKGAQGMNETTAEKLKPSHKESELLLGLNEYTSQAQELAEPIL
tara:strand:- start:154 stop:327 length:174 start_codon:yes stop_codon:yes gene_type:complete